MFLSQGTLVTKTPLSLTRGSDWFPSMPPMAGSWPSAYAGMYRRQLWVAVVVNKLAKAQARLPLPVYERGVLDRVKRDDHPMAKLLRQPNPGLSGYDLQLWTSATKNIYGDTFWYKQRQNGRVVALYPMHPSSITWQPDHGDWRFDNGKLVMEHIPDADLVHFRGFDPESTIRALSPLEPLRSTLENEWSARTATSSFWHRGARPGVALIHKANLSEAAQDRLKAQMDKVAAGADKTGATIVLEEGMEPKTMTLTAEEAQYIETRKLNREEVCAGYDVPPPVVHILDRATFSNITEQMRSMYRDTMGSVLPAFEAAIEIDLRQAEWPNDDVYAEFLMDEVLRGDFETRQDALNKANHMTIAEKRKIENLPFIEGTDRIFLNTATMPLDAIDAQARAIAAQTARAEDPLAEVIPLAAARSVMGRLSWQDTLDQVDARALTEGLPEAQAAPVLAALDVETRSAGSVAGLRERVRRMGRREAKGKVRPDAAPHEPQVRKTLADFFARQGAAVLDAGRFDKTHWDSELTDDLHATALAVSSSIGKAAMRELGYDASAYDVARTVEFLKAVSERLAVSINETTAEQYTAAVADPDADPADVFTLAVDSRAAAIGAGVTTLIGGFAAVESGKRVAEAEDVAPTKTWITGRNPRASHAAMNGQTVGIDEKFSNGMDWPGSGGDADDTGCNCSVEIEF
jgi:HK97 family phage portal protein